MTIRARSRATASKLQESDLAALNMAHVQTRRLEERVDQLERILDEDVRDGGRGASHDVRTPAYSPRTSHCSGNAASLRPCCRQAGACCAAGGRGCGRSRSERALSGTLRDYGRSGHERRGVDRQLGNGGGASHHAHGQDTGLLQGADHQQELRACGEGRDSCRAQRGRSDSRQPRHAFRHQRDAGLT
nr:envelope stress response membrane protein PspB [Asaia platycodi]